jgi:hypothetical protein
MALPHTERRRRHANGPADAETIHARLLDLLDRRRLTTASSTARRDPIWVLDSFPVP